MNQLAVNLSLIFSEVELIDRFALAAEQGFKNVEIQFPYSLSIEHIKAQLEQHKLKLCLINVPVGDLMQGGNGLAGIKSKTAEFNQALMLALEYALELKVPCVNILAGKQPLNADLLPCLQTLAQNLKHACEVFESASITPVIEMINGIDMPRFLIQNLAQAHEMLEAVNHPALKLQYDCYHMAMEGEDVLAALQENIEHIAHIQFADCPGRHQPDTGELNFEAIFDYLKYSQYQGYIAAEYFPKESSIESLDWKAKYFSNDVNS